MPHEILTHIKGDTFPGEEFVMTVQVDPEDEDSIEPMDLTGVHILMHVRKSSRGEVALCLSNYAIEDDDFPGGGITILDELNGRWRIDPQVIDIPPAVYVYDVQFTFPGPPEVIVTYISGTWPMLQDVTHGSPN